YFHGVLREVTDLDVGAQLHLAGIRRSASGNQLQQRTLTGAVYPHDTQAFLTADQEAQALVDDLLAIGLGHALELRHIVPGAGRRTELELDHLTGARRRDPLDLLHLLHA